MLALSLWDKREGFGIDTYKCHQLILIYAFDFLMSLFVFAARRHLLGSVSGFWNFCVENDKHDFVAGVIS